jgi:hypothetical protein
MRDLFETKVGNNWGADSLIKIDLLDLMCVCFNGMAN